MNSMRSALAAVGLVLLTACDSGEELVVSAVLPSPALPGQEVTVFGVLPAEASVSLEGERVIAKAVAGGMAFDVPEWTVAGTHAVEVTSGRTTASGVLQVRPRLDGVAVDGEWLMISGAGWVSGEAAEADVSVEVNGTVLVPEAKPGELRVRLPEQLAGSYGTITVRVVVGGQASDLRAVVREAGALTGRVALPAAHAGRLAPARAEAPQLLPTAFVLFHAPGTLAELASGLAGLTEVREASALGASRLEFADRAAAEAAYAQLGSRVGEASLEWDAPVRTGGELLGPAATPLEPGAGQWHLDRTGVRAAWADTRGEGVIIAVVDTGVDLDHPDLAGRLLPGYDFVEGDTLAYDLSGHGTHVAGLAAADGWALGTAPAALVLPVRVLEGEAGGSAFTVAQGVLWAAGLLGEPYNPNPADVINLSLGTSSYSAVLASAIDRALAAGITVVAATGNAGGTVAYPAALPGVVSVTALAGPALAYQPWYANHGPGTWVTAYGGDTTQDQDGDGLRDGILSTEPGGGYGLRMGTSMASPQVAGLAALAIAAGTPPQLVRETLARTATDLGVMGFDERYGHGLATARAASAASPRTYVLAFADARLVGWTLVQPDGSYRLDSLPPRSEMTLYAASDEDGNGVLGEAGELVSAALRVAVGAGEVGAVDELVLGVADGSSAVVLEEMNR